MDRKVIILTPSEWENRVQLGVFAQKSNDHNHFNKSTQINIKSLVWLALNDIEKGNIEGAVKHLHEIPAMCERIYKDSCEAQAGISGLARLIEYRLKEEEV